MPGGEHPSMVALSTGLPQLNRLFGVHRPSGELRWLLVTAVPISMEEESKREVIVTFNDVTQERLDRDTLELERSKSVHSAKLATLGEMAAGVAHEINNPLGIISGSVSLAERYRNDPEKVSQKLELIKKATARISKIVGGLRKFSRSNDHKVYSSHSLASIVEEAVALTEYKAKRGMTLVEVTIDCREDIHCDEIEIQQVLINLINNGIDAVDALEEKWVKIRVFEDSGAIVLRVQDSGPGIPEEVGSRLFQPFFTTKPVGQGTGLGLSIVKGIIDEHKGSINVMTLDAHTCFEARFPKHAINTEVA
jgi:C4-dicarboxylate-specific signal transduction histidine kinase